MKSDVCRELCSGYNCKLFCECLDRVEELPPCAQIALAERDKLRRRVAKLEKRIRAGRDAELAAWRSATAPNTKVCET